MSTVRLIICLDVCCVPLKLEASTATPNLDIPLLTRWLRLFLLHVSRQFTDENSPKSISKSETVKTVESCESSVDAVDIRLVSSLSSGDAVVTTSLCSPPLSKYSTTVPVILVAFRWFSSKPDYCSVSDPHGRVLGVDLESDKTPIKLDWTRFEANCFRSFSPTFGMFLPIY